MKWKIGKYKSIVVSDESVINTNFPVPPNPKCSPKEDIEYYGGYLVCESIGNEKHAKLISAAPELLDALKEAIANVECWEDKAPKKWYDLINKIEGGNKTQCRFCKRVMPVDKNGLCPECIDEGISVVMEPYQALLLIFVIAAIIFGAVLGLYWLFTNFPTILGVSHHE